MNEVYEIEDLQKLEDFLITQKDQDKLRETLFKEFVRYANYKNAIEWNKAVKICESLAIIGWGIYEPLEALRGKFFNGNPMTYFLNKFGESRFVEAIWSKRKTGFTMEQGRTSYHVSPNQIDNKETILLEYRTREDIQDLKIESQRNWAPKNPIWIERIISNCYENSNILIESIENELQPTLNKKMRPEKYGNAINRIIINNSHSFCDNAYCKTNYIISESDKKLSNQKAREELYRMYPKEKIEQNGYYLRNRFEYGPFRKDTGKVRTNIHFEKEFSELSHQEQKEKYCKYTLFVLNTITNRLRKKNLNYDFDLMMEDFNKILNEWK